jgi:hypothetical protein
VFAIKNVTRVARRASSSTRGEEEYSDLAATLCGSGQSGSRKMFMAVFDFVLRVPLE